MGDSLPTTARSDAATAEVDARGPDIVTLTTRVVYENRWTRVREDIIRRRDGSEGLYGVVERSDFAVIVPVDDANRVTLVEQYRYPVRERLWEFPMGMWEEREGFDTIDLAKGELREETGLVAGSMHYAGSLFQGAGYCNQRGHVFLARDLVQAEDAREASEQDLVCRSFALGEVETMMRKGELRDAVSLAAFGLLRLQGLI